MTDYNTFERIKASLPFAINILPESKQSKYISAILPPKRTTPIEIVSNASIYLMTTRYLIKNEDYDAAIEQGKKGIELISGWDTNFLKVDLHAEISKAYRLKTNFKIIIEIASEAIKYADKDEQKIILYELHADSLKSINDLDGAYRKTDELFEKIKFKFNYPDPNISNLKFLSSLQDAPKDEEWIHSLNRSVKSYGELCVFKCPEKLPSIAFAEVGLVFQYGKTQLALSAFVDYALCLSLFLGKFERGYKIAKQAAEISQNNQNNFSTSAVLGTFYSLFFPWKEPLAKSIISLERASKAGIEKGDFFSANIYALARIDHLTILGKNLDELEEENLECLKTFQKLNFPYSCNNTNIYLQMISNLKGESKNKTKLDGVHFQESNLESIHNPIHRYMFHLVKTILFYLFGNPHEANESAKEAEKYSDSMLKYVVIAQLTFFRILSLIACPDSDKKEVDKNLRKLQKWAFDAPENFSHWVCLVQAEYLQHEHQNDEAKLYYLRSIALANQQGRTQDAALANELTGRFYLKMGDDELAKQHLFQAHEGFCKWGATALAQRMEEKYECLKPLNLSANFSQTICKKILSESSEKVKRIIESSRAELIYNQANGEIEVTVNNTTNANLVKPYITSIKIPEEMTIALKIKVD